MDDCNGEAQAPSWEVAFEERLRAKDEDEQRMVAERKVGSII